MKRLILALIILSSSLAPSFASSDTIIIRKRGGRSKAILNKKFVYMDAAQAFQRSSSSKQPSNPGYSRLNKKALSSFARPIEIKPSLPAQTQTATINHTTGIQKAKEIDITNEDNWGDYLVEEEIELREDLSVQARIK